MGEGFGGRFGEIQFFIFFVEKNKLGEWHRVIIYNRRYSNPLAFVNECKSDQY
jgi:hypothetical protein